MASDNGFCAETEPDIIRSAGGAGPYGTLCDIGLNLLDDMFSGKYNGKQRHPEDIDLVLRRAYAAGVTKCILTAGTIEESNKALNYATLAPSIDTVSPNGVYSTVGIHPTRCNEFSQVGTKAVIQLLDEVVVTGKQFGKVVAIGECGLDYDRLQFCQKEQQMIGFLAQFELAEKHDLPMFLHDRNTDGDFLRVMTEHRSRICGGVVHSFTGTIEEMEAYVNLDLYIGVNGCSLKTQENLDVVKAIPVERILFETDAPWCGIKNSHASKILVKTEFMSKKNVDKYEYGWTVKDRCEPCMMLQIVEVVAALKGMSPNELAEIVMLNTQRLFFRE